MAESITLFLQNHGLSNELIVFVISMLPIVELRGAIPIGTMLGMNMVTCYIIAIVGNILPIPFILLFIRPIINFCMKTRLLRGFAQWLQKKADKHSGEVVKYEVLGLFLFVAIPLPGTGAWTGSLIASLLDLRLKNSLLSISLGVIAAGILMTAGSKLVAYIVALF